MLPSPQIDIRITASNQTGGALSAAAQGLDRVKMGSEAVARALAGQSTDAAKADAAMLRLATTSSKLAQAQNEVITAGQKLANTTGTNTREADKYEAAIRRLNIAQAQMIRDQQKINDARPMLGPSAPTSDPLLSGGASGGAAKKKGSGIFGEAGRGIASAFGQTILYGGAAVALGGAYQGVNAALNYDTLQATTRATTGISAGSLKQITDKIATYIASGKSQYDSQTLLQGAYSIISTGITDPNAVWSILQQATASSTASGAPDIATSSNALTTVLNAYGYGGNKAAFVQNQISEAGNQGKADPTEIPAAFATFARSAALSHVNLDQASALFAFDTLSTRSAQQSGQNVDAFFRSVMNPNAQQRKYASVMGVKLGPDAIAKEGMGGFISDLLQRTGGDPALLKQVLGNVDAASLVEGIATQPGKFQQYLANQKGLPATFTQANADIVSNSESGRFKGQLKKAGDAFQHLAEQTLPSLVVALGKLSSAMDATASVLSGPGGKGGLGASVQGAGRTLMHFLDPTDAAFGSMDKARLEAGQDQTGKQHDQNAENPAQRHQVVGGQGGHYQFIGRFRVWIPDKGTPRVAGINEPGGNPFLTPPTSTIAPPAGMSTAEFARRQAAAGAAIGHFWNSAASSALPPPGMGREDAASAGSGKGTDGASAQSFAAGIARGKRMLNALPASKKTGDMTSAMQYLQGLIAFGASEAEIEAARKDYIAAVHDSPLDPKTWPYYEHLADKAVDTYHKGQAALKKTADAQAAQSTYGGLLDQATLAGMQGNTAAQQRFTQQADSFELSHAALLNKTGVQAQIDVAGRKTNAAGLAAQATYKTLQERLTLAQVQNNPAAIALATKNLNAFESGNATLLGIDSTQVQIDIAQRAVAKAAQPVLADGPTLLRPNMAGLGALSAGPGGAAVRFGRTGSDPMTHQIRILEAQLAAAKANEHRQEQMIKSLQDQLNVLRDSRGALNTIVTNTAPAHPQHTSHSTHHPYGRRRGH